MTATAEHRVDQLVQLVEGGHWHAPGDSQRVACGLQLTDELNVAELAAVADEHRCPEQECRRLWSTAPVEWAGTGAVPLAAPRPRPDADAAPTDGPAPLDDMDVDGDDRPLNPVESEAAIRKTARLVWRGVRVVSDAESTFRAADVAYERAFAQAYLDYDGPAHAKKYAAQLATHQLREARDVAELAFKHADRLQRAKLASLDAVRSVNASVRAMYGAETGVGR